MITTYVANCSIIFSRFSSESLRTLIILRVDANPNAMVHVVYILLVNKQ